MLSTYFRSVVKQIKESLSTYTDNGMITLYHYTLSDEETLTLDPSRVGEQSYSKGERRFSTPRIFFYLNPEHQEAVLAHKELYITQVNVKDVYDSINDPLELKQQTRNENNGILDVDMFLQSIIDNGFKGMYYRVSGMDIVVWFYPIEVHKEGVEVEEEGEEVEFHIGEVKNMSEEDVKEVIHNNTIVVISANRDELDDSENNQQTRKLKQDIESMGYPYTQAYGGYVETDDDGHPVQVKEKSFMLWGKDEDKIKEDAIRLGEKYNQETILYKPEDGSGHLIGTKSGLDYINYREEQHVGDFVPNSQSEYFTQVGDFSFEFK